MDNLVADDLTIEVDSSAPAVLRLQWLGKSNARQPSAILSPYFETLAAKAAAESADVEMHFERLEHFNSSTITTVIQLIQNLRRQQVKLTIVYDGNLKWQKLSFDALRIFEKDDGLLTFATV